MKKREPQQAGPTLPGAAPRRPAIGPFLLVLFFTSGATSLVYQTLWARQFHLLFGTSQLAISAVLAAFMGGLAAGGFAAARWERRLANPLYAYACLEAFVGAYALALPTLLDGVSPLYLAVARTASAGPLVAGAFQSLVAGLLLLPPTFCMGATLPVLARLVAAEPGRSGRGIGRLYGANTLGAVLGTALGGFVLLPSLGLSATTWWAAAANGLLAVAAGFTGRLAPKAGEAPALGPEALSRPVNPARPDAPDRARSRSAAADRRARDGDVDPQRLPLLLALLAGLTGFTGLLYEVAWFRLLTLVLGASAYAFSILLLAFLLGLGIGGWVGGPAADSSARRAGPGGVLRGLAAIEVGVAALSWGAMFAYAELPFAFVRLYALAEGKGTLIWLGQLVLALAIMTPPAVLMGASFPYLTRAASVGWGVTPRAVGVVYGANTLGAIGGAVGGGLVLLPALHVRGAVALAAALNVGVALLALVGARPRGAEAGRRAVAYAVAALAMVAAAWSLRPPWEPLLMTSGVYKYVSELKAPTRAELMAYTVDRHQLLFYDEGPSSVVTVARHEVTNQIWLANNGKIDASTGGDLKTQFLLGHLPFAFRPRAEQVLIVGLASGITAGAVTLHPSPRRIDVVEIEPAVVEASHFFDEHNHRPLEDPRVRLVVDDARRHLQGVEDAHYDVVSSEPSNPWITGVSNLFTREFFELGRRKLAPTGVFTQWVHCYEMAPDDLRSLLATFADVFPEVAVFRIDQSDLIVLGSESPLVLDAAALGAGFAPLDRVTADLAKVGINKAEDILAHYWFGRPAILELAGDIERNTDDNMRIEYSAPLHLNEETRPRNERMLESVAELPIGAVRGAAGVLTLAEAYTRLEMWGRAVTAISAARRLARDEGGGLDDGALALFEAQYRALDESSQALAAEPAFSSRGEQPSADP